MKWAAGGVVLLVTAMAWGEVVHRHASRRWLGTAGSGPAVVVVFGCRNRDPRRANALNRWRVRAALRSVGVVDAEARMIFSGGDAAGVGTAEAVLLERYAVSDRGFRGQSVVEGQSLSTWENVRNVIPLIEWAGKIIFVSNPLHAQKARLYLRRQRPDLARRLVRAEDYRFGEWSALKPFFAVIGLRSLRRGQRAGETAGMRTTA